jgi:prophage regulatory protein
MLFVHVRTATGGAVENPTIKIIRLPAVKERTGLGTTSIYKGVAEGWFPRPIRLVGRSVGWLSHEVDAFITERVAASRQPTA